MSPITLNDFSRLAGQVPAAEQDTTFLKVSDGELSRTGRAGNFFTTEATRRESIDAFAGALRAEYGDHIADMIDSTSLSAIKDEGKPLTARMVQDLTRLAREEQTRVNAHNEGVVNAFLNGEDPENGLDKAIGDLCAEERITSPQDQALLREKVQNFLLDQAGQGGFHPNVLTADALKTGVARGLTLYTGFSNVHKEALLNDTPGPLGDKLRLADMGLGKTNVDTFAFKRSVGALDAMRQIQPEEELSPETVYRALFKQDPPEGLGGDSLIDAIETRCEQDKAELLTRTGIRETLVDTWTPRMPWERFASLVDHPDTITRGDVESYAMGQWSGKNATVQSRVETYLRLDPGRDGFLENGPVPSFSFQLDDGQGGTRTEKVEVGRGTSFPFENEADRRAYIQASPNSLSRRLAELSREICGPGASEAQVTRAMYCLTQGPLLPLKHAATLAGTKLTEHSNVSVNLSRQPDGSIQADFASPEATRDALGHFNISLSIDKDGEITLKEYEITPPLAIRQQREDEAVTQASNARVEQALTTAAPFRALDDSPDGLFAQVQGRALALAPEARLNPKLLEDMDSEVGRRVTVMARESAQPLTQEQILAVRADVLNEFFDKLGEAAAQVPAEQRGVFTRGCLELGYVPDPALLPAIQQMTGSVTGAFRAILNAGDGNKVRRLLNGLALSMHSATTLNPHFADKGADFFTPAHHLAMRMSMLDLMGKDNPQAFAQALTRPGPFRDALYSVGSEPTEENGQIRQALNWFNDGMTRILPDETLTEIRNPHEIHERDLSLPRQREILGEGVYAARGAGTTRPALAALNRNLSRDMPAIREHIRASAETDLRLGPGATHARAASGLSEQFAKDYPRDGVFVDGRYYNPHDPQSPASSRGTGTSEQDFIALFPDARTAGLLSNLAAQNLQIFFQEATTLAASPETSEGLFRGAFGNPDVVDADRIQQNKNTRIETLNADQGRYRLTGFYSAASNNPESAVERFMYEVTVDVNLGPPGLDDASRPAPTVEDARVDFLLRGREVVPGEE